MPRREWRAFVAGALVLGVLSAVVGLGLSVTTDITRFLPHGQRDPDVDLARRLATGELSRTMVLLVDGIPGGALADVSREFEAELRAEPGVAEGLAFLEGGPPTGTEQAIWELYRPRRFAFAAGDPAAARELVTADGVAEAVAQLKRRLATPMSNLLARVAPEDPFLCLPRLFERLQGARGRDLAVVDGRFATAAGDAAVLFAATRAGSADSGAQRPFLAGVRAAFARVDERHGGALELRLSGANRFAVAAETAIKGDVQRVTIGSALALLVLFGLVFGSLRLVVMTIPVLSAGFLAGATACIVLFGEVHGMTLAFGAAMIGVSIDYAIHFHAHHTLAPHAGGPRATLRAIWPGLLLGAATTVVGFVALIVSTFPGLREMAVFAAVGITAALFATRVFLPGLAGPGGPTRGSRAIAARLRSAFGPRPGPRARVLAAVPAILTLIVIAIGLPRATWDDGLASLNRLDPELLAEDEAVRERVVRFEQRRMVVATGVDDEAALRVADRATAALDTAVTDGVVAGFRSVSTLLPSAARQREIDAVFRDDPELWPRVRDALVAEDFAVAAFEPFREALDEPAPAPITWDDLAGSPLASLLRAFRVTLGSDGGVGYVAFLHGLDDADELAARLAPTGARLIDVEGVLSSAYRDYRVRMATLLSVGLLLIVVLVALRHGAARPRRTAVWRATLAACVPAFLAAGGAVAILALAGISLNVLSLVALLMVVSMGVDYGVFLVEHGDDDRALDATHLAIAVAAASTVIGFGLLGASAQPALRGIGLTAGLGVLLSVLLAPTIRVVTAPAATPPEPREDDR